MGDQFEYSGPTPTAPYPPPYPTLPPTAPPYPTVYTVSAPTHHSHPAPSVIQVSGCPTRSVISGQLPVEINCWNCHRVHEKEPNGAMICVSSVAIVVFIIVLIGLFGGALKEPKPTLFFGLLIGVALLTGLGLWAASKLGGESEGEWRVYHYCPSCHKVLANVPAENAPAQARS